MKGAKRMYRLRKGKHNTIIALSSHGLSLLSKCSEWTIRLFLQKLREDISRLKGEADYDYDSVLAIEQLYAEKPSTFFEGGKFRNSWRYIDGLVNGVIVSEHEQLLEDIQEMYLMLSRQESMEWPKPLPIVHGSVSVEFLQMMIEEGGGA
jgi:hypothetical protein